MKAFRMFLRGASALLLAAAAHAQITPSAVSVSPGAAKPGDLVTFIVTASNTATTNFTGAFDFTIDFTHLSTGATFTVTKSGVAPKGGFISAATVDPQTNANTPGSGTYEFTGQIPTQTTQAGAYRAKVTMGSAVFESTNPVLTVTGKPDFAITSLTYPAGISYKGGDVIPITLTFANMSSSGGVHNVPWVPASPTSYFRIELVLSTNPVFGDADDFLLTFIDMRGTMLAELGGNAGAAVINADGADRTISWNQLLPGNFAGSYYVLAKIDSLGRVDETTPDDDLTINGNNVWYDTRAPRLALQPTSFPTVYMASTTGSASGNNYSDNPAVSADGRYTVFVSDATDLVTGDTNNVRDVFIFDLQTSLVRRVNVSQQGAQANAGSSDPAISDDGRYVAFASDATNLVFGDTNGFTDIFVVDTITGTMARESVGSNGVQSNGSSFRPALSSDGRYIVFESNATNLTPELATGITQIYVRDRIAGTTALVSQSSGTPGNGVSLQAVISGDGRYVAFASDATNLVGDDNNGVRDIFLRDITAGTTTRISVDSSGVEANGPSRAPSINRHPGNASDGRYIAFGSEATNLVAGDTNDVSDIFVRDRVMATTTRVSVSSSGAQAHDPTISTLYGSHLGSINPSISATGRYVAFASLANNLTPGDAAGRYAANDRNESLDVFVVDRDVSGGGTFDTPGNIATSMVSVNRFGYQTLWILDTPSTPSSDIYPVISSDGRWVAFPSDGEGPQGIIHGATNRVSPDLNNFRDVFLHDRRINALPNPTPVPTVAITQPVSGSSFPVNSTLAITATALPVVGSIASVQFFVDGTSLGAPDTTFPYTATWTPTGMGTFTLSAIVTDTFGNKGVSGNANVAIVLGAPPSVAVTNPIEGSTVTMNAPQSLRANATSANGTIASVQFFANGAPVGSPVVTAPFTATWTPAAEGVYRITAAATDNAGLSTTSTAVTVIAFPTAGAGDAIYSGNFAGLGESGRFAAITIGGRDAAIIGFSSTMPQVYFFSGIPVDAAGGFALFDPAGGQVVSATANATGLTGTFDGGRLTLIGPVILPTGASPVPSGYYSGSIAGRPGSALAAIVGPDGTIFIHGSDGASFRDAGAGSVNAMGEFNVTTPQGNRFTGTIDPKTGFLTGSLMGSPIAGSFTAAATTGVAFSDGALRNLSTRGQVGTGPNVLIAGFVIHGNAPKQVLARAIGPALASFGVTGALADPQLQVFSGATVIASNDNWTATPDILAATGKVGAFPLTVGSRDAAVLAMLGPGSYTAQVSGVGGTSGVALFELYDVEDATPFAQQRLMNVSTRGVVGSGQAQLIAGFVVSGTTAKKVLVRVAGPALASLGVTSGFLADPVLRLVRMVNGTDQLVRENDNWETGNDAALIIAASGKVGAFPFATGSRDAAILINLPPGTYSAQAIGANNTTGIALVEVYEVP